MPFDENIRPDIESVMNATALLDVTEYELFRLAYRRWHGMFADDKTLEPYFMQYMFSDLVPVWVRHFSRLVERLDRAGRLNRVDLGIELLPRSEEMVTKGMRYSVLLGVIVISLMVLGEFAAQFLKLGERCMFPPCY